MVAGNPAVGVRMCPVLLPDPHKKIPALCVNPLLPKPPNQKSGTVSILLILFVQARGPVPLSKDQQEVQTEANPRSSGLPTKQAVDLIEPSPFAVSIITSKDK